MKILSHLHRILKQDRSILFGIIGMLPFLFLLFLILLVLLAPGNWNEMVIVPSQIPL